MNELVLLLKSIYQEAQPISVAQSINQAGVFLKL